MTEAATLVTCVRCLPEGRRRPPHLRRGAVPTGGRPGTPRAAGA